jgi:hypothetical protein
MEFDVVIFLIFYKKCGLKHTKQVGFENNMFNQFILFLCSMFF